MSRLTRREFLKLTGSAAVGAALLGAGCAPAKPAPTTPTSAAPTAAASNAAAPNAAAPSAAPTATPAASPTATLAPTDTVPALTATAVPVTATPLGRADLMRIYPAAPSRVVQTRHSGVWSGDTLSPEVLGQMLDASLTKLTGLNDAQQAWRTLFDAGERIALKVNTIQGSSTWTHVPLVTAIAGRLQAAGIAPEQITIYDRTSAELRQAGFTLNADGAGVRCAGTDNRYTSAGKVVSQPVKLSNLLLNCDALINVPLVKQHGITGFSFALKNHYGTIHNPSAFHTGQEMRRGLAEISTLPPIKDKTRLIIGDALTLVLGNNWNQPIAHDTLFMSFDPVAHDTLGLQLLSDTLKAQGRDPTFNLKQAGYWLASGAELGLGTNDPAQIDLQEISLT